MINPAPDAVEVSGIAGVRPGPAAPKQSANG